MLLQGNINVVETNKLVLASIGDAYYELYIREYLVNKKINKVNDLQKELVKYVSAKKQALFLDNIISKNILLDNELNIVKGARNTKIGSHPKNTDTLTYKHATALEALIGYLYLTNNEERLKIIMKEIVGN